MNHTSHLVLIAHSTVVKSQISCYMHRAFCSISCPTVWSDGFRGRVITVDDHPISPFCFDDDIIAATPALNADEREFSPPSINGSAKARAPSISHSSVPPSSRASLDPRRP